MHQGQETQAIQHGEAEGGGDGDQAVRAECWGQEVHTGKGKNTIHGDGSITVGHDPDIWGKSEHFKIMFEYLQTNLQQIPNKMQFILLPYL